MTDIVMVPAAPVVPPFPALGAPNFNQEAYDNGSAMPGVSAGLQAIALTAFTNATVAGEKAAEAALSKAAADADAVATAADRVQTGLDRVAASALVGPYLGSQATDPATGGGGASLVSGNWYINTTTGFIRAYTMGGGWVNSVSAIAGVSSVNGNTGAVALKTINGEALTGSGNILTGASIFRSARTSNAALSAVDKGNLIDITSGTFTQTFGAADTLGDGWWCYLRNSGAGDITLDPNGSETIDGLASYVMYPGEVRLIQSDGTALRTMVLNSFSKTFTASGSFIDPPGYAICEGLLFGGGGGGGSGAGVFATGGGGGACCPVKLSFIPGTVRTVTIGSGGAAATAGGNSTFAGFAAYGGGRGIANSGGYGAGGGGTFSAGSAGSTSAVMGGGPGLLSSSYGPDNMGFGGGGTKGTSVYGGGGGGGSGGGAVGDSGGVSVFGGGGGASAGSSSAGPAAVGIFGGSGGAGSVSGTGGAGTAPAGGGGGAYSGTGGAGARGELRIWGLI